MSKEDYTPSGCGIVGSFGIETSQETLEKMTESLAHRGPDSDGFWTSQDGLTMFGHRRLAIVGIDERGRQPMTKDGITVTYNGEIYNYPYLKKELEELGYQFTSTSDTEAILYAYQEYGPDCVKHFNGIFAFGLYDERTKQLMLARDHVGVKPLCFTIPSGKGILFASEPKALFPHPDVSCQPNYDVIKADMIHGYWGPKQQTWFEGVLNLEPGNYMLIDTQTGEKQVVRYWEPPSKPAKSPSGEF